MSRILLLLDHTENRRLLAEWLGERYQMVAATETEPFDSAFDLCILDGQALARHGLSLERRKLSEPNLRYSCLLCCGVTPLCRSRGQADWEVRRRGGFYTDRKVGITRTCGKSIADTQFVFGTELAKRGF